MKYLLVLLQMTSMMAAAQKALPAIKDTVTAKLIIKNNQPVKKTALATSISVEIENALHNILKKYCNKPNTAATWLQVKAEAEKILYGYFKDGKLIGTKTSAAYFVKMDALTISATDIVNKKMIVIAGIATVKPAEFTILTIEEKCLL